MFNLIRRAISQAPAALPVKSIAEPQQPIRISEETALALRAAESPSQQLAQYRRRQAEAEQGKAQEISSLFGGLLQGVESDPLFDYESYLRAGSKKCWALFRAVDTIAKAATDTPFRLQRKGGDGSPVEHKEIGALLANPNPFENGVEMLYKTFGHLNLTGNAFWLKDQPNFNNDRPQALYSLNPKRIRIVLDADKGVTGYLYHTGSFSMADPTQLHRGREWVIPLEVDEVLHFRVPHVNNDFWGLGVVEAGEDLFQSFLNHQGWENKFWKNGASPSGILVCEDQIADRSKWEEEKARWKKEYGGVNNSGKIAWLTGKWKFEQLGLSKVEMQDIESSKWTIEQIFMQCGVPLSVAGIKIGTALGDSAAARADDLRFRRYTVKPLVSFVEKTINSDLVEGFDPKLELIFSLGALVDLDNLRENFLPLFDRGAISINELRSMAGLQPDPENDLWEQHFINAGMVPLDLSGVADLGKTDAAAQRTVQRAIERMSNPGPAKNGEGKRIRLKT